VKLVESGPRLFAVFPERVASAASERLEKLRITVRIGARPAASPTEPL
jgi:NADH dehydrogenase